MSEPVKIIRYAPYRPPILAVLLGLMEPPTEPKPIRRLIPPRSGSAVYDPRAPREPKGPCNSCGAPQGFGPCDYCGRRD